MEKIIRRSSFVFFALLACCNGVLVYNELGECLNYTVYPLEYNVAIIPYIYEKATSFYNCEVNIRVIANVPNLQLIELDAGEFEIESVEVWYEALKHNIINEVRPYFYNRSTKKLTIYLKEPMIYVERLQGPQYIIKIKFRKEFNKEPYGIKLVPYEAEHNKHMIFTRITAETAKFFFPCFGDPRLESGFHFMVYIVPTSHGVEYFNTTLVIANQRTKQTFHDGTTSVDFNRSPQVKWHEVGFHFSDFHSKQINIKNGKDVIRIWAPRNKLPNYDKALEFSEKIVNVIINYSGVNKGLVEYGPINIVAVPGKIDGFEIGSWNLLTNGENILAYIIHFTSCKQQERMMFELTQQFCRIWLGNPGESARTMWREEWFKEGMATYLTFFFMSQYHFGNSQKNIYTRPSAFYALHAKNRAMTLDWMHSTPSLYTFNNTLAIEIPPRYKELVHFKTASLLWMIENWLGSERYHRSLVNYINSKRGTSATIPKISLSDYLTVLDTDTVECTYQYFNGSTSSRILYSWFHQYGYPVITVNVLRDRTPNAIQLKQHKFSFIRDHRSESNYLIPITYVVQNTENCNTCHRPRFTIQGSYTFVENLDGGWILLNTNATGYYRVNYDRTTWKLIAQTLAKYHLAINAQSRAQIINDVFALYVAGDLDIGLAMEILGYLGNEIDAIVWDSAISGFELLKIKDASCNMTKNIYREWQEFMSQKVTKMYNYIYNDLETDLTTRLTRTMIVEFACRVKNKVCLDDLRRMQRVVKTGKERIDPDLREAYYYMIINDKGHFGSQGFNIFEIDDKIAADHKWKEDSNFQIYIPQGPPILEHLNSTTTKPPTHENLQLSTLKPATKAAPTSMSSLLFTFVAFIFITIAR